MASALKAIQSRMKLEKFMACRELSNVEFQGIPQVLSALISKLEDLGVIRFPLHETHYPCGSLHATETLITFASGKTTSVLCM
jgi:hypothetical protein